ncbi:MAG: ABC transporter transmembrane domain-containing protein [Hyphomicrobiaceae bacterium]
MAAPLATHSKEGRQRTSMKPLLALKPYILAHPKMLVAAAVAMVVSALAMLLVPMAVRRMIDEGFSGASTSSINLSFIALMLIGAVLACASAARFYFVNWLGERVVADLRRDVFKHLLTLGPDFYDTTRSGEVMSRLTADTTLLKSASGSSLSQASRNTIMLLGALTMMILTSPKLTSLVALAIPAIVLPLMAAGRMVRTKSRVAQDVLADASAYAQENLSAIRTLKAASAEQTVGARFAASSEEAFEAARARLTSRAALTATTIVMVVLSVVGVLWYGATRVVAGELSGGVLGQFILYALFAGGAMAELSEVWGELSQASGAAERLAEILLIKPSIPVPDVPLAMPTPPRGQIGLTSVTYSYPSRPETKALDQLSLDIRPGERVAIVGASGAGKSTIFSALLRFFDPNSGTVKIDDVDVRLADPAQVRARFAVVPQDISLFAASVAENIGYGAEHASRDAIIAAARAAEADDFIRALPQGYDTRVGERGLTLSGGQRQRIAIARAVLRDAPILLLDEATSSLDAESEAAVQRALDGIMRGRTTLVIAHRLATVQKADRILVMDAGRIVESGTHDTLVAKGGIYARLAALQFGLAQRAAE